MVGLANIPTLLNFGVVFPVGQAGVQITSKDATVNAVEYMLEFKKTNKTPFPRKVTTFVNFVLQAGTNPSTVQQVTVDLSKVDAKGVVRVTGQKVSLFGPGTYKIETSSAIIGPLGMMRRNVSGGANVQTIVL